MTKTNDYIELSEQDYIKDRLLGQQKYHSKKATKYKKLYYFFTVIGLIMSLSIPIVSTLTVSGNAMKIITAILGALVSLCSTLLTVFKFQELWLSYRNTSESLKQIGYLYKTKTSPYNKDDAFERLVLDCESLLNDNRNLWSNSFKKKN